MRLLNVTRGTVVAASLSVAESRRERARGLLGRSGLEPGEALLIPRCRQVHAIGMRFAIDVVFLDGHGVVLRACSLSPGRMSPIVIRGRDVVELRAGVISSGGVNVGDMLRPEPTG
ncbi:MAG: DUF192 domain-containing protein [Actinobacteria bacterium]|nr:DUF192 domain-containing protein [Actinomycetota bacterium]MBU1943421.1 DUF192 domain-containing protein [Actinomycetota bacterium]MBU2686778.1 DUF192 domain-containing protein [Actinomycetota bacterium]